MKGQRTNIQGDLIPDDGASRPKTTVVNLRLAPYDIYIGRAGKGQSGYFGNPFPIINARRDDPAHLSDVLDRFTRYFIDRVDKDPEFRARVLALRGKRLGCFCVDRDGNGSCHGKIIARWIDDQPEEGQAK